MQDNGGAEERSTALQMLADRGLLDGEDQNEASGNQEGGSDNPPVDTTQGVGKQPNVAEEDSGGVGSQEPTNTVVAGNGDSNLNSGEPTGNQGEEDSYFSEDFLDGMFKGKSKQEVELELRGILENQSQMNELRDEAESIRKRHDEMLERLKGQDLEMLTAMSFKKETGIQSDDIYNALKEGTIDNMSDEEVVIMQMYARNPKLLGKNLDSYVKEKFKLDPDEYDSNVVEMGQIELANEAQNAREYLNGLKDKIKAPDFYQDIEKTELQSKETFEKLNRGWTSVLQDAGTKHNMFSKVSVDIDDDMSIEIDLDPNRSQEYMNEALKYAVDSGFGEFTEEEFSGIQDYTRSLQILDNLPTIIKTAYEKGVHSARIDESERLHNPSGSQDAQPDQSGSSASGDGDWQDQLFRETDRRLSGEQ